MLTKGANKGSYERIVRSLVSLLDEPVDRVGAVAFLLLAAGFDLAFGQDSLIDFHLVQEAKERLPLGAYGKLATFNVERTGEPGRDV
ncbi:MAG: hypothetical protein HQ582_07085, partial [Planctomycetes bacterium]|nr:hypothetical protein [Planctomycetota bacterium]